MTRLFVTGPCGSGKTTLARRLAQYFFVPLYALDNIHWQRRQNGDRRRPPNERARLLAHAIAEDRWVVEGVQFKWAGAAIARADLIVVLDPPAWRAQARLLRRFLQRRGRGHRGKLTALREELRWCADYYAFERRMLFSALAPYADRVIVHRR